MFSLWYGNIFMLSCNLTILTSCWWCGYFESRNIFNTELLSPWFSQWVLHIYLFWDYSSGVNNLIYIQKIDPAVLQYCMQRCRISISKELGHFSMDLAEITFHAITFWGDFFYDFLNEDFLSSMGKIYVHFWARRKPYSCSCPY